MTARKATTAAPEGSAEASAGAPGRGAAEARMVALADILARPEFQIRKGTDAGTVARYVAALRAGAQFPPVKVATIGGALVLLDGFHRVAAHREAGRLHIAAEVVEAAPHEARWLAAEANMGHGLPLRRAEVREAFRAFVRAKRHMDQRGRLLSLREVAQRFGAVGHTTIREWFRKDFPRIARAYAGDEHGGGLQERRGKPLDFAATAEASIAEAVAAARGVADPHRRGAIVDAMRRALTEVEKGGPFLLPDF